MPLLAAAIGGGLVALLNARTQRDQHLREQMLKAADEFAVAYAEALLALRKKTSDWPVERPEETELARVRGLLPRVQLLFHPDSLTAQEAEDALDKLNEAHGAFRVAHAHVASSDLPSYNILKPVLANSDEAEKALDPVTRAAWAALTRPRRRWLSPAVTRAQRMKYLQAHVDLYRLALKKRH